MGWREYDSTTTGEITDRDTDYRPDGVRGPDLTRSYRGQCNTINDLHLSLSTRSGRTESPYFVPATHPLSHTTHHHYSLNFKNVKLNPGCLGISQCAAGEVI